jgi:hypothetical protein
MSELNIDVINKAIKLIKEFCPPNPIEMILLTDRLSAKEVYQVKYKDKKYLFIPHQIWILILKEIEPRSFCNHDFVSCLCETYCGIPICENDELVMEILEYVFKNLNMIYSKDEEWKLNTRFLWGMENDLLKKRYKILS